jgi:16S rRNA (cytidine1402-2'-O)-methyltransferase
MGTLYLVATPIGNLEDITLRALRILSNVRLIAAEDTRRTRLLLQHYKIATPLLSYHEHNKTGRLEQLLETLSDSDVALVSDAGTPLLNDPGYELVCAVLDAGYDVSPIPGPSAPLAALVASGQSAAAFLYLGYLPRRRKERLQALESIAGLPYTLIFLETPHRLQPALTDIEAALGNRQVVVAREITKIHEEFFRGNLQEARLRFTENPPKGEITLVIAGGAPAENPVWEEERLQAALVEHLERGGSPSQIARDLARESGWPRSRIYPMLLLVQDREKNEP